ncbi:plasmid recombination protein [Halospeciosus flavus]|uniref:Plasmid recombination protein n=1 Tax=Halospeciosus flavus TaxID=3032283 RepID=A0ABD5Z078_9EURY
MCFGEAPGGASEPRRAPELCLQSVVCYASRRSSYLEGAHRPMSYAVLRMQKFKQPDLKGIQFHNQRERESQTNMDIDPERTKDNYDLIHAGPIDYNQHVNGRIEEARKRKPKSAKMPFGWPVFGVIRSGLF